MTSNTDGRPALSNELIEQFSLHDRTAVITGAAGGIGRQAAITFTQAGANVVIADVGVAGLEETAEMVAAAGGNSDVLAKTPEYLSADLDKLQVTLVRRPKRDEVPVTCEVQLVVEYYAAR